MTTGIFNLASPPQSFAPGALATIPIHVASNFGGVLVSFPYPPYADCGTPGISPASVNAPGDTSFTLNTTGCALGKYKAVIIGRGSYGRQTVEQGLAIPFVVGGPAPPNFSITPTPSTRTVVPGASDLYTLNVASINGFSQPVSLAVSGLPAGVTASFPTGSSVIGSGTLSVRVATSASAAAGTYTITLTGTSAGLPPRTITLTLNISAPQPQSGFTLGDIPAITIPADGTVFSVPIQVINNGGTPVTLRSVSSLPPGMNVTISGHTLMISAASTVPGGTYAAAIAVSDGSGNECGGGWPITVVPPGGGGSRFTMYLQVPDQIAVLNDNQATRIGTYYAYSSDGTPAQPQKYPAGMVQSCSAGSGISVAVSWPSQSVPSDVNLFDISYTVAGTTAPGDRAVTCQVAGYLARQAFGRAGVSVYQTPSILTSVDQSEPTPGGPIAVTITGTGFGSAGTVIVCALATSTGPCTPTTDITVGQILWGATITAVLTPVTTLGPAYCVQVSSTAFAGGPTVTSVCTSLSMATVTLTPSDVSGNPGDVFTFTASASSGTGTYNWSKAIAQAGDDASAFQFVSSACPTGPTCPEVVPDPHSCPGLLSCTVYVQAKSTGFANVGVAFQTATATSQHQSARVRAITVQITKIWSDQFPDGPVANQLPRDFPPGSGAGLVGNARQLLIVGVRDSRNGDAFPLSGWKGYIKVLVTTSPGGGEALDHILVRVAQGVPLTAPTAGSWATAGLNTPPGGVGGVNSSGLFSVAIEQSLTATDYAVVAGVNRNATMNQVTDTLTAPQTSTWFYLPCPVTPASHGPCSNGAVRIISLAENVGFEVSALGGAVIGDLLNLPTAADHLSAFVTGHAPLLALPAPNGPNSNISTAELLFNIGLVFATGTSPYGGPIYEYQYANTSGHATLIRADSDFRSLILETISLHKAEVVAQFSGLPPGSNFTFPAWQAIGCSSARNAGYVGPCLAGGNTEFVDTPASTADRPALFPCSAGSGSLPSGVTAQALSGKECDLTFSSSTNLNYAFGRAGYNFTIIANVTSVDPSHFLVNSVSLVGYLYDSYQWNPAMDAFLDKHLSNIQAGSNAADRVGQVFRIKVTLDTSSPIILPYAF